VPTVRADAILSPLVIGGDDEEPTIKQAQESCAASRFQTEKLSASRRSTFEFFGVIRMRRQHSVLPENRDDLAP
jgi:hypothetical protein